MAPLIRFKMIEIDSKVFFIGKKRKILRYPVRSISLVPEAENINGEIPRVTVPEIFWQ
jgi:hypothetical protein